MKATRMGSVAFGLGVLLAAAPACAAVPAWNAANRAETLAWFLENEYGARPAAAERPDVTFAPACADRTMMEGRAVRKRIRATVRGPYGDLSFMITAFIPSAAQTPAPAFVLICNRDATNIDPERQEKSPFWPAEEIVARGYAAIAFCNAEVAPDFNFANTRGVFACYERYDDVKPKRCHRPHNAWGTLSAWAWGASRVMDWIETEPRIDAKHVAVVGHSRGGKTALLAGVTDARFAMACVNDSGCSGAKLNRMDLPHSETIAIITRSFPYWFCNNYRMWCNRDAEMPFDQHQFLALMAPRLVAVASASEDAWAGPQGEFESCRLASGAWEACGAKGLVADAFPPPDTPLQDGSISYHVRTGKHNLTPYDWTVYMDFADRHGWRGQPARVRQ